MKRFMESLKGLLITVGIIVAIGGLLWVVNFISSLVSIQGIIDWFLGGWLQALVAVVLLLVGQMLRDLWFNFRGEETTTNTTRGRRKKEE